MRCRRSSAAAGRAVSRRAASPCAEVWPWRSISKEACWHGRPTSIRRWSSRLCDEARPGSFGMSCWIPTAVNAVRHAGWDRRSCRRRQLRDFGSCTGTGPIGSAPGGRPTKRRTRPCSPTTSRPMRRRIAWSDSVGRVRQRRWSVHVGLSKRSTQRSVASMSWHTDHPRAPSRRRTRPSSLITETNSAACSGRTRYSIVTTIRTRCRVNRSAGRVRLAPGPRVQ